VSDGGESSGESSEAQTFRRVKDLCDLQRGLDDAVAVAYGWPTEVEHDPFPSTATPRPGG